MTPLVHGRRTLRRLPRGGVLGRRFSVWDAMGYHGIAWASNHDPLTVPTLKEWLRVDCPADALPGRPAGAGHAASGADARSRCPGLGHTRTTAHHARVSRRARHQSEM